MGAFFSSMSNPKTPSFPTLGDLPENCVAMVMGHMDPPEICKLAMVNRAFRDASRADFVWESKLPLNYEDIFVKVCEEDKKDGDDMCKKDVYARLCRVSSLDDRTKKVWLDKNTGKTFMLISSNGLAITGIDDRRYWTRIPSEESRFSSVAYLQQIWWFEVDGEIEFPFPQGSYSVYFRLQLGRSHRRFGRRICDSKNVHGWDKKPARFQVLTSDSQQATRQCYLKEPGKWTYYHAGDFVVSGSCRSMKVKFSMTQIDCTHTKGGLCVDSVLICPVEEERLLRLF